MIVLLDTGPLGLVTNPRATAQNVACRLWVTNLAIAGVRVLVPEIADYELRRELIRVNRQRGIAYLDRLATTGGYDPPRDGSNAASGGVVGAGAPDGDVILAAQALVLAVQEADQVLIATTNPGHLQRYAPAEEWSHIQPPSP
jgi:hypothetical protein